MALIGMPSGQCRRPLGKMTKNGLAKVIEIVKILHGRFPEILEPIETYFNVSIEERLVNQALIDTLSY